MKICFIGLGSIGGRHLKNLVTILQERELDFQIDALRSKNTPLHDDLQHVMNTVYYDLNELENNYDIVFICNPTNMHYSTLQKIVSKTSHIFIEKPVFDSFKNGLDQLMLKPDCVYYVACPLRYTKVFDYIKELINKKKIYSARAISSSYLPDWRKEIDYRKVYSANKALGGGVTLDLIHEWDYIIDLFGFPLEVYNINGKYSHLKLDSDDISIYIAKYMDKLVEIHLDYFGRKSVRQLELFCEDCVINADFINATVRYTGEKEETLVLEKNDMYKTEMNNFLDMIINGVKNNNTLQQANSVLGVACCKHL